MIPYDGNGYGRSVYWEMKTKEIARKNHEYCTCWDFNNPIVNFSTDGKYKVFVACYDPEPDCKKNFQKTDKALTKKFKEFYK